MIGIMTTLRLATPICEGDCDGAVAILGVSNVFLDVRVGWLQSGIQATGVIIESGVDSLFYRACVSSWFCVDVICGTWGGTKIDAAPQTESHVVATRTSRGQNLHITC